MTSDLSLISVIIPVYNCDRYLAEAIESVLNQTYPAIELIVVDDGSSDRSAEIAQRYPLTYHFQPNAGIGAARNAGIALAKGKFLAFLDSDDIWVLDKLSKQMQVLDDNPTLEAVFGYAQQFYSPELDEAFRQRIRCPKEPIAAHLSTAMLIKREAFLRIGMFDSDSNIATDVIWYIWAIEHQLRQITIPDVVYRRRLHRANNGLIRRNHSTERLYLLKAKIDRERTKKSNTLKEKH